MLANFPTSSYAAAFGGALGTCILLFLSGPFVKMLLRDRNDARAVQASHCVDRLRLGGIGILTGFLLGLALSESDPAKFVGFVLFACALPVVIAGVLEDMGYSVKAKARLVMALVSSGLCVVTFQVWVSRGDWAPFDMLMGTPVLGIMMTILIAGVFSHSVNLIDGMNGLCGTAIIFMLLGFAAIGHKVDAVSITMVALLIAAAIFGFLVMNWPVGLMFMGDAGAYGLGHCAIWLGILLLSASPEIAVPAVLLVLFYPLADTLHSVARRVAQNHGVMEPDRMHLHHKVRRGLEILWLGCGNKKVSNPFTTVFLTPFLAAPVVAGVVLWNNATQAWIAVGIFSFLFAMTHVVAIVMTKRLRKRPEISSEVVSAAE